jgi:Low affinity iron permease
VGDRAHPGRRRGPHGALILEHQQRSQNKDAQALHLKLNEVVAVLEGASNRLMSVEDLTEEEVRVLRDHYRRLVAIAKSEATLTQEAEARHRRKKRLGEPLEAPASPPIPSAPTAE